MIDYDKKKYLIIGIVFNVGILFIFKYLNLITQILFDINIIAYKTNILLPIGISFYTFQSISYLADIYRGDVVPEHKIINLALYISMFPQLVAGPIVRYKTINNQIKNRITDVNNIYIGIERFIIGLSKKVLIANNLSIIVEELLLSRLLTLSITERFISIIIFTMQLYFDFSGYSDMAIGLGMLFGFEFPENFNYPFIAKSMSEFWKRWHISLGTFFRDYIYIPLGGNRKNQNLNLFIVWLITGIWHGAKLNYVLWGLFLAIVIIVEKNISKLFKNKNKTDGIALNVIRHIYLIIITSISFSIFYFENVIDLLNFFSIKTIDFSINSETIQLLLENMFLIIISLILCTPILKSLLEKIYSIALNNKFFLIAFHGLYFIILLTIFVSCILFLIGNTNNPFLYTRF